MEELPSELLLWIFQYALCPAKGIVIIDEPRNTARSISGRSTERKSSHELHVRVANRHEYAGGLLFASKRFSALAAPILFSENTFSSRVNLESVRTLLQKLTKPNLKRIKAVYLLEPLPQAFGSKIDLSVLSSLELLLRQDMKLRDLTISVPQAGIMMNSTAHYKNSLHGKLCLVALDMLRRDKLRRVRLLGHVVGRTSHHNVSGEATIYTNKSISSFIEPVLLDPMVDMQLVVLRRSNIPRNALPYTPPDFHLTSLGARAHSSPAYQNMLRAIREAWRVAGFSADYQHNIYLDLPRWSFDLNTIEDV